MFWETCAKHSFEIIAALLGAGIIGYLWSRWFGGSGVSNADNSAYENQIKSLRDRIRQQDIDLQATASLRDTWTTEKEGLNNKINELAANLDQAHHANAGFISPDVHMSVLQKAENDMQEAIKKHGMLIAEREGLMNTIKGLETKVTQATAMQSSIASAETKIKDLEAKLRDALAGKGINETQLAEQQKHDAALLEARVAEVNDLKARVQQANAKSSEIEGQLVKLKEALADRDRSAQDAEIKAKELDKHYNNLIIAKDEEIRNKVAQLSAQNDTTLSQLAQKEEIIKELQNKNQQTNAEVDQLQSVINKYKETDQVSTGKINELLARVHQLEQESSAAKAEAANLKNKVTDSEKASLALLESDKKIKEWEGRWKQASTDAEHYKLAHTQTSREHDQTKMHVGKLESELNDSKQRLEQLLHEHQSTLAVHEASIKEGDEIKSKLIQLEAAVQASHSLLESVQLEHENSKQALASAEQKMNEIQSAAKGTEDTIVDLSKQLDEARYFGAEWEGRFKDANEKLNALTHQLEIAHQQGHDANTRVHQIESQLIAANDKLYQANNQLSDLSLQLEESKKALEQSHQVSHAAGEWESKYKELSSKFQSELAKAQQTIAESRSQSNDLEAKHKELNNKFNSLQLQLSEVQHKAAFSSEIEVKKNADLDTKYKEEADAWNKRIAELEAENLKADTIARERHAKEITDHKKQIARLLDVIADLKVAPKEMAITANPALEMPSIVIPKIVSASKPVTISGEKTQKSTSPKAKASPLKPITIDYKAASTLFGKKIKADDHKIVEGIGPKIEGLLKKAKIKTWTQLANTPIRDIQTILDQGGNKFSLADPTSWPAQARLASMGEWVQLKKLQDNLTAGKARKIARSKPSKTTARPINLDKAREILGMKWAMDDLKIVEGIGPKIEKLLHKANIRTWKALANTNAKNIQAILDKAGSSFTLADPKTWAKQSSLAASGQWNKLKSLQGKLKGGK
jgi:chromosome segregation ATPase/predicted flap endonuclease-1-like 5' DNA nuclease